MDLRRILITGVLLGTGVWAWFNSPLTERFRGGAAKRPVARAPLRLDRDEPGVAQPATGSRSSAAPLLSREELDRWRERYGNAWRRDPFLTVKEERALRAPKLAPTQPTPAAPQANPAAAAAPLPSYSLKAVLISEAGKVATLDGRLVGEGERIGEERVVEIRSDGVVLERAGRRRWIGLSGGDIPIAVTDSRQKAGSGR